MKKFILLLSLAALFNSCVGVKGNGNVESSTREVDSFTGIRASGIIKVIVKQGDVQSVNISADANILPLIETSVSRGVLTIRSKKGISSYEKLIVNVVVPKLESVNLSGAAGLSSQGKIKSSNMDLEASGSSDINIDLECHDIEVELSGSANIDIKGSTDKLEVEASGASSLKAYSLQAKSAEVETSGASGVKISVEKKIKASASGASNISFKGNPKDVVQSTSGAASINSK